jgi:hypothetical protein
MLNVPIDHFNTPVESKEEKWQLLRPVQVPHPSKNEISDHVTPILKTGRDTDLQRHICR